PSVSLFLFVLGAIFFGLATPSEGAALGALGGIILAAAHKRLSFGMIRESVFLTVRTAAMVGWLLVGSSIFAAVFARLGGAQIIGNTILGLNLSPEVFFWTIQIIIFVLGWPLEWTEITIIFMPLFLPLLATYHQQYPDNIATDAFFFGIMAALNQQTSFLSPPVAMSAYYLKGVAGKAITLNEIFTGMYPFLAIQVVSMGVLWLRRWRPYGPAPAFFGRGLGRSGGTSLIVCSRILGSSARCGAAPAAKIAASSAPPASAMAISSPLISILGGCVAIPAATS